MRVSSSRLTRSTWGVEGLSSAADSMIANLFIFFSNVVCAFHSSENNYWSIYQCVRSVALTLHTMFEWKTDRGNRRHKTKRQQQQQQKIDCQSSMDDAKSTKKFETKQFRTINRCTTSNNNNKIIQSFLCASMSRSVAVAAIVGRSGHGQVWSYAVNMLLTKRTHR